MIIKLYYTTMCIVFYTLWFYFTVVTLNYIRAYLTKQTVIL